MVRIFKATIRENRRIIEILQNHIAEEKRTLQGYDREQNQFIDFGIEMDIHLDRVSQYFKLIGEIGLE